MERAPDGWYLSCDAGRLILRRGSTEVFQLDTDVIERRRRGFARSLLGRACAVTHQPVILDALGGWGTDGQTLAQFGCKVVCCESVQLVYLLCLDRTIALDSDMDCRFSDVRDVLRKAGSDFDVIYLDAMFPEHPTTASPQKAMQLLAELAQPCDLQEIFELAMSHATNRVVVKRRRKQQSDLPEPTWAVRGRSVRYDVYKT